MFRVVKPSLRRLCAAAALTTILFSAWALQGDTCQPKKDVTLKKASCTGPPKCSKDEAIEAARITCAEQKCTGENDPKCPAEGKCDTGKKCLPYMPHAPSHKDIKKVEAPDCKDKVGWQVTLDGDLDCKCKCRKPSS